MTLAAQRNTLIAYLLSKVKAEDWHGVSDAANDLREIDREFGVTTRIVSAQHSMNNDWLPLRADMREVAIAHGFETRERDGGFEVRR